MDLRLFATVPKGMETLLAGELRQLGAGDVKQARAGVAFAGDLETAYRVCLWSRLASRLLLPLIEGRANDGDELYATAQRITWDEHLPVTGTLAVDFTGTNAAIRDTRFGAVRVKDAIVDQFRTRHGDRRPTVDTRAPDLRVNAHLARGRVTLSLDLSGQSLHRRSYRVDKVQVEAPLKENLAAAVLLFAEWPRLAAAGYGFVDPLCGSGTLPVEAALIAADIAPGLLRAGHGRGFGFERWLGHDAAMWAELVREARERRTAGLSRLKAAGPGRIRGLDRDGRALRVAGDCVARAGLSGVVTLEHADLATLRTPAPHGLLAANPPYGERLGGPETALPVYRLLGEQLRAGFDGWRAAVLAGDPRLVAALRLSARREATLYNGALPVLLTLVDVGAAAPPADGGSPAGERPSSAAHRSSHGAATQPHDGGPASPAADGTLSGGAEQFANRLRKNRRQLARLVRREELSCYRLYDADLPDYNLVVDVYGERVVVQEYAAPAEIDPAKTSRRLQEALAVIATELETPAQGIVLKERRRQRGSAQYERLAADSFAEVDEDGLNYLVNLTGYLDAGLFIDQRLTRRLVRRLAGGRRFLNLFAYTGTMTVNALAGGSMTSTSVDLSTTYLDWARRNLAANGFAADDAGPHRLIRADALDWISGAEGAYDLIWLDPPTFSNSKRMGRATFDVQRDHADLIRLTARRLLAPGGLLLFATNRRGFRLDRDELAGLDVKDLSRATLTPDCARAAARHHVFQLQAHRDEAPEPH
jgi:23S rRNA (guanine2445-N2)-methyltransferase / 23S rRNA (guanine2069-N7)-methyltransferase